MMDYKVILFFIMFIAFAIYILLTYLNRVRYKNLCERFKLKFGYNIPETESFRYFNFSLAYISIPFNKFIYVYNPLTFNSKKIRSSVQMNDWKNFILSQSIRVKKWFYAEIAAYSILCVTVIIMSADFILRK